MASKRRTIKKYVRAEKREKGERDKGESDGLLGFVYSFFTTFFR
jgi:hypothetical protein